MEKYRVLRGYVIYPDDIDYIAEGLSKEDAEAMAKDLKSKDNRCNVFYVAEKMLCNGTV